MQSSTTLLWSRGLHSSLLHPVSKLKYKWFFKLCLSFSWARVRQPLLVHCVCIIHFSYNPINGLWYYMMYLQGIQVKVFKCFFIKEPWHSIDKFFHIQNSTSTFFLTFPKYKFVCISKVKMKFWAKIIDFALFYFIDLPRALMWNLETSGVTRLVVMLVMPVNTAIPGRSSNFIPKFINRPNVTTFKTPVTALEVHSAHLPT